MEKIGLDVPARRASLTRSRRRGRSSSDTGFPAILRPSFTMGGSGGGIAYTPAEFDEKVAWALAQSPTHEVPHRGERPRVEGVRARGHARPGRQLHRRLLDREPRPDGRAHGRLDHRRAGDDAHRPRVPAPARRGARGHDRDRRRDGRRERAVLGRPEDRALPRHRDEPARVAELGAGEQGDRVPHREDRGEARRRLHARRAPERHHADERRVRAGHRLRRRQVAALRVREVPRRRHDARHADEERRRGDEHRAHVLRGAAEGRALARDGQGRPRLALRSRRLPRARRAEAPARPRRWRRPRSRRRARSPPATDEETRRALEKLVATPTADRLFYVADAMRVGFSDDELYARTAIDPWFLAHIRRIIAMEEQLARGETGPTQLRAAQAPRLQRPADRDARGRQRGRRARPAPLAGHARRSTRGSTRAPPSSSRTRPTSTRPTRPRARRSPTRTGARSSSSAAARTGSGRGSSSTTAASTRCMALRAARASRPSWSTATRRRCRPTTTRPTGSTSSRSRSRTCSTSSTRRSPRASSCSSAGRRRSSSPCRSRSAACSLLGTSADAIDRAEDRGRFDELLTKLALKRPRSGIATTPSEALGDRRRHRLPGARAPELRARRARDDDRLRARASSSSSSTRAFEAAREAGTQTILVDEFLKDAIEVDVDCVADGKRCVIGGVMQHIEEAGVHSGDSSSVLPPHSLPPEIVAQHRGADAHARARARRRRPDERAVRGQGRRGLHPRGQPAREPHGAVRLEGDRAAAREDRRAAHGRARRSTSSGSTTWPCRGTRA